MRNVIESILSKTVYPALTLAAMAAYSVLIQQGWHILAATYLPVVMTALLITLLERYLPEKHEWKPQATDIRTDLLYMGLVQLLLPRALVFLATWLLLRMPWVGSADIWPRDLPVAVQLAMMLLLTEFFRYWLHRIAHEWPPLWRLHAVHHSAEKLYWLNVGRFHPLEKSLQFLIDVLPFMALGVNENVLALYFIFYAVNGFFQHCNIRIEFGWLNYVFSTAALHRWHHSRAVEESCTNYGNNLIVWDLLFGTWFLPKQRQVGKLGPDRYPAGFIGQLAAPFRTWNQESRK